VRLAVSRRVAALEEQLEDSLFERRAANAMPDLDGPNHRTQCPM
jgi:DNA-binding transcriptional LysR family regulator